MLAASSRNTLKGLEQMPVVTLPLCKQCKGTLVLTDVFRCGHCGKPYDTGGLSPMEFLHGTPNTEPIYEEVLAEPAVTNEPLNALPRKAPDELTLAELQELNAGPTQEELQDVNPLPERPAIDLTPVVEKPLFEVNKKGRLVPVE